MKRLYLFLKLFVPFGRSLARRATRTVFACDFPTGTKISKMLRKPVGISKHFWDFWLSSSIARQSEGSMKSAKKVQKTNQPYFGKVSSMKKKKRKSAITLIEIMIVILLIGLITGALAFNMSGSLDKGRAFKTEQNIARIRDILLLEHASSDEDMGSLVARWKEVVTRSPLVLNKGAQLMLDGWKEPISVEYIKTRDELKISSRKLVEYKQNHDLPPAT